MIRVLSGLLTEAGTEAIVRPIRTDLSPVTPTSRDLQTAAGPAVDERLARLGTLPLGGAVMTPAGELAADFLIHVVVMSEDEPQTTHTVQRGLRNGLGRAADWGITSLALPPLGLGVGLIEPEESARALVEILLSHLEEEREPLDLAIVTSTSYEEELLSRMVQEATRGHGSET